MKTFNFHSTLKSISSVLFISLIMSFSVHAQASYDELPFEEYEVIVEDWMTDIESFNTDEPNLEIESWMTDLNSFANNDEVLLVVEDWMTDLASFNVEDEEPMYVELWMTSLDEYYNGFDSYLLAGHDEEPLEIENWMTDLSDFYRVSASEIEGIKDINLDNQAPILIALKY